MKKYWKRALIVIILILFSILAVLECRLLKNEHVNTNSSTSSATAVPEPKSTIQDSEYINVETQKLIFGEWHVCKLIGFTDVQNDYTNYPKGHDIIGDHIIISEKIFSSKGISKYERYESEISNPTYALSDIKDKMIMVPIESIKEDEKIYSMIQDAYFQDIYVKDKFHSPAAVNLIISSDSHLILEIDGAFYLLEKIEK